MTPTHAISSEAPSSSPGSAHPSAVLYGEHVVRPVKPDHSGKIIVVVVIAAIIFEIAVLCTQPFEGDQAWESAHPQHQNFIRNTEILHLIRGFLRIFNPYL